MSPQGAPRGREPDGTAEAASIEDKTLLIQTVAFVASVLPAIFVFLRVLGRRIGEVQLGPDDYIMVAALIPQCFYLAFVSSYGTRYGYGVHIWDASPLALFALAQTVFVAEIGYALTFTLTKLSTLSVFYRTIGSRPHAMPYVLSLVGLVLSWCFVVVGVTVIQCLPPRAWWDRFHPDHPMEKYQCRIESRNFLSLYFLSALMLDFLTLLMPASFMFTVRLGAMQLYTCLTYYLLGVVSFAVSLVKIQYIRSWDSEDDDPTYNLVQLGVWMMADSGLSLISANWPFFIPGLDKLVCGSATTTLSVCFRLLDRIPVPGFLDRLFDRGERPSWPVVRPDTNSATSDSSEMTLASSRSSAAHAVSRASLPSRISNLELPPPWEGPEAGSGRSSGGSSRPASISEDVGSALQWAWGSEILVGSAAEIAEPAGSQATAGSETPSRRSRPESILSLELTEMRRVSD